MSQLFLICFYMDDCLLFVRAKASQVWLADAVLHYFCLAFGLKVNLERSKFMASRNVLYTKCEKFVALAFIHQTDHLGKYLGFPLVPGLLSKKHFEFIIEKMQSHLASWKGRLLNKPGRLVLANSFLQSIPSYTMQAYWLPTGICDEIDAAI